MPTIFTRIIEGEVPARLVWRDERCVAFLPIAPVVDGHTLVVPVDEVDHWIDLEPDLVAHLVLVGQRIGRVLQAEFEPTKVGVVVAGEEVPHVHLHLMPFRHLGHLDLGNADPSPDQAHQDRVMERIRAGLRAAGDGEHVPG